MGNELLTSSIITKEALRVLENNLKMASAVRRDFDDKFAVAGAKIGDTLNIRKPPRYQGREGAVMQIEASRETSVPLVLNKQYGCDISFSSVDLTLSIDDFSKRFIKPAVATVANKIDRLILSQYINVSNFVGTPGAAPSAAVTYLQAGQKLDEEAVPVDDDRTVVINPAMQVAIVDALKGLFNKVSAIASQFTAGRMGEGGMALGFNWIMDQNVVVHTVGLLGGTPLANAATDQTGSSIITDGWTNSTGAVKKGDILTFDGVYAVNPQSRDSTQSLRQFRVLADATADSGGNMTILVDPPVTPAGAFQTTDSGVTNNAIMKIFGSATAYASKQTPAGIAFHRDAFTLGTADLQMPNGVDMSGRVSDKQLGISIRMVRQYGINDDSFPCRLDVLCGAATLYQELACRVQG